MAVIRQREVEFKLIAPSAGVLCRVPAVLKSWGFHLGPARRQRVRDVYLDTPDFRFYRAGLACRLRIVDGAAALSLKTLAPQAGGLASREECTEKLRRIPRSPIRRLPGTAIVARMDSRGRQTAVRVLFELRQQRTTWKARSAAGLDLAISADTVRFPDSRTWFYELELELVRGNARSLRAIGRRLGRHLALVPDKISKFERGLKHSRLEMPPVPLRHHRDLAAGNAAELLGET